MSTTNVNDNFYNTKYCENYNMHQCVVKKILVLTYLIHLCSASQSITRNKHHWWSWVFGNCKDISPLLMVSQPGEITSKLAPQPLLNKSTKFVLSYLLVWFIWDFSQWKLVLQFLQSPFGYLMLLTFFPHQCFRCFFLLLFFAYKLLGILFICFLAVLLIRHEIIHVSPKKPNCYFYMV